MESLQMLQILEQYCRQGDKVVEGYPITRISDWKSTYMVQNSADGQTIVLAEFNIDGKNYWAGSSSSNQTIFVSHW
jgi:hypothetical protein